MIKLVTCSVWAGPAEAWRVEAHARRCTYIPGRFPADQALRLGRMRDSLDPGVRQTYEETMADRGLQPEPARGR
jgi:hypothetical protein